MGQPEIYGTAPPPWPNETIAILSLISALFGLLALMCRIQKNGLSAFRRSALFLVIAQICFCAYWAAYTFGAK